MTIRLFVLHRDPEVAASLHTDRDVTLRAVVLPSILVAVHHYYRALTQVDGKNAWFLENGREVPCPASVSPLTLWASARWGNYAWLYRHLKGFLEEYQRRYGDKKGKRHHHWELLEHLREPPRTLRGQWSEQPFAMTAFPTELYELKQDQDVVDLHRALYRNSRSVNRPASVDYSNCPDGVPDFML